MSLLLLAVSAALLLGDRPAEVAGDAVHQAEYKRVLRLTAIQAEASFSINPSCMNAEVRDGSTRVFGVNNPQPGFLPKTAWETLSVSGCGRRMNVNILVVPHEGLTQWNYESEMPGDSHADPSLQVRTLGKVIDVLNKNLPPHCDPVKAGKNLTIGEVKIVAPRGTVFIGGKDQKVAPKGTAGDTYTVVSFDDPNIADNVNSSAAWQEEWPLKACGVDRSVVVLFAPYKTQPGTMFSAVSEHWQGAFSRPASH
jgi:hypothetical protein